MYENELKATNFWMLPDPKFSVMPPEIFFEDPTIVGSATTKPPRCGMVKAA